MQADHHDPRPLLLSKIDLTASRVEFSNTPIVLLCGGPIKTKVRPDDPDLPIASLRDAITRSITTYEIFRPEEIDTWHSDGLFKNLMDFEADLASICSLVVIVLESQGAFTELGAFSQLPDLSKKIIAIRSNDYAKDTSFINLGILRYLTADHPTSVKSYPWKIKKDPNSTELLPLPEITPEVVADVISDIQDELNNLPKSQVLRITQRSHIVVAVCEMIRLFVALKEHEILEYLQMLGAAVSKDELKRTLFLLERFRLIKKEEYSDSMFFMRTEEQYHKLRWVVKDDANFDALRMRMECIKFYGTDRKYRNHSRAITRASGGGK